MREPQARTIYLKDYTPPAFKVDTVELDVDIREDHAIVGAKLPSVMAKAGLHAAACVGASAEACVHAQASINVSVHASASVSGKAGAGG